VGSEHPVVVQSMINEDTLDIEGRLTRRHPPGCMRLAIGEVRCGDECRAWPARDCG